MPRQARMKSMTGIYHIMVRGINKEQIFNRPIYKNKILQFIVEIRKELEFHVIAYCVMNNHMHLLLKADDDKLEIIMKKLNVKYAMYYNKVEDTIEEENEQKLNYINKEIESFAKEIGILENKQLSNEFKERRKVWN